MPIGARMLVLGLIATMVGACAAPHADGTPADTRAWRARVDATLDALHANAAAANFGAYFALFTPDAIFLGTDGTERWTLEAFKEYTRPYFESGRGWTFTMRTRHIEFSPNGMVAWFDEILDNKKYGECRGTGVLERSSEWGWRIAQYSLAKTIPNERMEAVVEAIGADGAGK